VIPALLAVPAVESVLGGVVGSVANIFSPSAPPPSSPTAFNPYLNAAATAPRPAPGIAPSGSMRADDWGQMSTTDLQTWTKGLAGKHVDATDQSGRTISGVFNGMQQLGSTVALNIGGHLVTLSQLKQVSWSPSVA
jgi:hypothetical protein